MVKHHSEGQKFPGAAPNCNAILSHQYGTVRSTAQARECNAQIVFGCRHTQVSRYFLSVHKSQAETYALT